MKIEQNVKKQKNQKEKKNNNQFTNAQKSAKNSEKGVLSEILFFTENNPNWTLLYDHIRVGQIDPRKMKK